MITFLIVALLTLAPLQEPPSLLPETPDDWRYERLDFPLSFAPELEFGGFEELRFAPGMFDADSESYFSYILGMRLAGELDVDESFLEAFFSTYFKGLCTAVAKGRGLDLDLSKISVSVKREEAFFSGTVEMLDPFVTAGPLRLILQLSVHHGPRETEIFGLASPASEEAAIRKQLRGMAQSWRAARPAAVFFNHLYVVPDAETYAALAGSEFLREAFAVNEERETVRTDMSYSGIYFYGQRTYFEFLPPQAAAQLPAGSSGVAFGLEAEGGTESLAKRLAEQGVKTFAGPRTHERQGEHLPWFQIMGMEQAHTGSRINFFSMQYDPGFLNAWHADLPPRRPGISRRDVLRRYAEKLGYGETRESLPFEDVTRVHLALDERERERLLAISRASGYRIEEQPESWTCEGPGIQLVVNLCDGPGRVTGFEMALRKAIERDPIQLGKALLSFEGDTAFLDFEP